MSKNRELSVNYTNEEVDALVASATDMPEVTGIATFTNSTNNIALTGIGELDGLEVGDVIQISGAEDSKNNSEFTVEVITDNDNIIVNQAHANKGTSKNVANRSGDTGVTVKLLAKWYSAPIGLGQGSVIVDRNQSTNYTNSTKRSIEVIIRVISRDPNTSFYVTKDGIDITRVGNGSNTENSFDSLSFTLEKDSIYSFVSNSINPIILVTELR